MPTNTPTSTSVRLEAQARRLAARAMQIPGVRAVVLFGSVAAGQAEEWSDCDLLVVAEGGPGERAKQLLYGGLPEAQVLVRNETEIAKGCRHVGSICRAISLSGRALAGDWSPPPALHEGAIAMTPKDFETSMLRIAQLLWDGWENVDWIEQDVDATRALVATSADAAERLAKCALDVRDDTWVRGHNVRTLAEAIRHHGQPTPPAARALAAEVEAMDHSTHDDHMADYLDRELEDPQGARERGDRRLELASAFLTRELTRLPAIRPDLHEAVHRTLSRLTEGIPQELKKMKTRRGRARAQAWTKSLEEALERVRHEHRRAREHRGPQH